MDNIQASASFPVRDYTPKAPRVPARFLAIGTEKSRKQANGDTLVFRVVLLRREYTEVYSKLDGYSSTWYTEERAWAPTDSLIEGQKEVLQII